MAIEYSSKSALKSALPNYKGSILQLPNGTFVAQKAKNDRLTFDQAIALNVDPYSSKATGIPEGYVFGNTGDEGGSGSGGGDGASPSDGVGSGSGGSSVGGGTGAPVDGGGAGTAPTDDEWDGVMDIGFEDLFPGFDDIYDNIGQFDDFASMPELDTTSQAMLNQVFDQGLNGSIASFDTAANRLRERTDMYANTQREGLINENLGRGFQGSMRQGLSDINRDAQYTYGQGLGQLEDLFEGRRLEGLGIANNAAGQRAQFDSNAFNTRSSFTGQQNGQRSDAYNNQQTNSLTGARDRLGAINDARRARLGLLGSAFDLLR